MAQAPMTWSREFFEPIVLPDGRELVTLRDAGEYIGALPAKEQQQEHWQDAAHALMTVVNLNGDPLLARIGMMRALNAGKPAPDPAPRSKRVKAYRVIG